MPARTAAALALVAAVTLAGLPGASEPEAEAGKKAKRAARAIKGFSGIRPRGDFTPGLTARLVKRARGNTTRSVIHWQAIERHRDRYESAPLNRLHRYYRAQRKRGIKPILVLQHAPVWARDPGPPQRCGRWDGCHYPPSRSMLGEWREFVAMIARRFPKASIEVWNEPNYVGQWESGVDPARYAQLLAAANGALNSVDPGRKLYPGGLGVVPKPGWIPPADFLRAAIAARPSLTAHADAINLHVYPTDGLGPGSSFRRLFGAVRKARDDGGAAELPLLVTELGLTTSGHRGVGQRKQARVLRKARRRILNMRDSIGVLLYTLADRRELGSGNPERGFGAVRPGPGTPATSYTPKRLYRKLRRR